MTEKQAIISNQTRCSATSPSRNTVYSPSTDVFKPIRTDGTFDWWPKENCYTKQHKEKIPIEILDPKKISPVQRENPYKDFFWKINFSNTGTKSGSTTSQGSHTGELQKLKVLTRHSTEPTHSGTLKTQTPHTPQLRVYTHGNFKNSKSSHTTAQSSHTWEL